LLRKKEKLDSQLQDFKTTFDTQVESLEQQLHSLNEEKEAEIQ
jgi:hypothetical protein